MNNDTQERLKQIKRSFRPYMNGVTAQSMRDKGVDYHLNWGVPFTQLRVMAQECGQDYDLAIQLWKENVRECKILATMVMPPDKMLPEVTQLWVEQADTQELAEMLAFNLLQHLDYAPLMAFRWLAEHSAIIQTIGYLTITRLLMQGRIPDDRGINELIDQATTALQDVSQPLRRAASNCLYRLASISEEYTRVVNAAVKHLGMDFS